MGYLDGFGVIIKKWAGVHTDTGARVTTQYPEEVRPKPERFHGRHVLNRYEDGMEKCIGCELCAGVCPAKCIYVRGADNDPLSPTSPGERFGFVYEINYLRCIHCDLCVEACPTEAITETKLFEFSFTNRRDAIYTKAELLVDDEGKPKQLPWENWDGGFDPAEDTSGWMRATSPGGDAEFKGLIAWAGELGYGVRPPERAPILEETGPVPSVAEHEEVDHDQPEVEAGAGTFDVDFDEADPAWAELLAKGVKVEYVEMPETALDEVAEEAAPTDEASLREFESERGKFDSYGEEALDWGTADDEPIESLEVEEVGEAEPEDDYVPREFESERGKFDSYGAEAPERWTADGESIESLEVEEVGEAEPEDDYVPREFESERGKFDAEGSAFVPLTHDEGVSDTTYSPSVEPRQVSDEVAEEAPDSASNVLPDQVVETEVDQVDDTSPREPEPPAGPRAGYFDAPVGEAAEDKPEKRKKRRFRK